jgi:peptidoglycan/LPS O-acetylase OafA/YrhL
VTVSDVSRADIEGISLRGEPDSRRRVDIQALRALAVTLVVLFHAAPGVFRGGFIGVDVFFVISGYLVGGHLFRRAAAPGGIGLREFFARRARRIVPVSALVASVTIGWAALTASPLDLMLWGPSAGTPTYTRDAIASLGGVSNLWFGVSDQGYLTDGYQSPYTQYWSLGVEEQFYIAAPLLLALVFWLVRSRRAALLVIGVAALASFDLALYGAAVGGVGPFFSPLTRAWELAAGLLVAALSGRLGRGLAQLRGRPIVVAAAWTALALCAVTLDPRAQWPSALTMLPVAVTALALAVGAEQAPGRLAGLAVVQWLGDRSYSIYLWHWPVLAAVAFYVPSTSAMSVAGVVVATLAFSWGSYRWVEAPLRRLPVAPARNAGRTMGLCAGIVTVAVCGVAVVGARASTSDASTEVHAAAFRAVPVGADGQEFAEVVPQNLRPNLAQASQDLPVANLDGCNVSSRAGDTTPHDCVYGTAGPLIALFGDSHALQWLGALMPGADAGRYRITVVTSDGCPPFGGTGPEYRPGCTQWHPAAIARVRSLDAALVLISASTWREHNYSQDELAGVNHRLDTLESDLAGVKVAWIADTPSHDFIPAQCAVDNVRGLSECSTPRGAALESQLGPMFEAAAHESGWAWLDFNDYLCSSERCGVVLGDVFMYRDDDHITATLSTELAPVVEPQVEALSGS